MQEEAQAHLEVRFDHESEEKGHERVLFSCRLRQVPWFLCDLVVGPLAQSDDDQNCDRDKAQKDSCPEEGQDSRGGFVELNTSFCPSFRNFKQLRCLRKRMVFFGENPIERLEDGNLE